MRGSPLACLRSVLGERCGESKPVECCTCPRWSRCAPVRLGGAGVSVGVLCFWGCRVGSPGTAEPVASSFSPKQGQL